MGIGTILVVALLLLTQAVHIGCSRAGMVGEETINCVYVNWHRIHEQEKALVKLQLKTVELRAQRQSFMK